jgi:hypothetical protein
MAGIRPPAHWTRVTSYIAGAYSISFGDAKFVYDRLREQLGRAPSLRAAAALPNQLPDSLWGVKPAAPPAAPAPPQPPAAPPQPPAAPPPPAPVEVSTRIERLARRARSEARAARRGKAKKGGKGAPRQGAFEGDLGKFAPPPPAPIEVGVAQRVDGRIRPKTAWESTLAKYGLPIKTIARDRSEAGRKLTAAIAAQPSAYQERLGRALGRAYKQVSEGGRVSPATISTVRKLIKQLGGSVGLIPWGFILKGLYGRK